MREYWTGVYLTGEGLSGGNEKVIAGTISGRDVSNCHNRSLGSKAGFEKVSF